MPTVLKPSRRRSCGSRCKPQRCDGQRRQRRGFLAWGQNKQGRRMKARQRPGRAGRLSNRKARGQSESFSQSSSKIGDKLRLAAEQMC